jgi:ankyrin repeat protein
VPRAGHTAFLLAARGNQVETAKWLLSAGSDRSARTNDGATALIEAAAEGQLAMCKWLLENALARVTERSSMPSCHLRINLSNARLMVLR